MYDNIYPIEESHSKFQFEFYSIGPNGKIKKRIVFIKDIHRIDTFHIGFGDVNEEDEVDDLSVSDNKDSKKILLTVVFTIHQFLKVFPNKYILVHGSTPARTRLYQIGIRNHWEIISQQLEIYGLTKNKWKLFEQGVSYNAFLIKQKIK
jgi:hypothetical protein